MADCAGVVRSRLTGDAGEDGGEESWVGARAKRAFFTVGGGVMLRCWWWCWCSSLSLLKEEYGLLCAVLRVDRRGE